MIPKDMKKAPHKKTGQTNAKLPPSLPLSQQNRLFSSKKKSFDNIAQPIAPVSATKKTKTKVAKKIQENNDQNNAQKLAEKKPTPTKSSKKSSPLTLSTSIPSLNDTKLSPSTTSSITDQTLPKSSKKPTKVPKEKQPKNIERGGDIPPKKTPKSLQSQKKLFVEIRNDPTPSELDIETDLETSTAMMDSHRKPPPLAHEVPNDAQLQSLQQLISTLPVIEVGQSDKMGKAKKLEKNSKKVNFMDEKAHNIEIDLAIEKIKAITANRIMMGEQTLDNGTDTKKATKKGTKMKKDDKIEAKIDETNADKIHPKNKTTKGNKNTQQEEQILKKPQKDDSIETPKTTHPKKLKITSPIATTSLSNDLLDDAGSLYQMELILENERIQNELDSQIGNSKQLQKGKKTTKVKSTKNLLKNDNDAMVNGNNDNGNYGDEFEELRQMYDQFGRHQDQIVTNAHKKTIAQNATKLKKSSKNNANNAQSNNNHNNNDNNDDIFDQIDTHLGQDDFNAALAVWESILMAEQDVIDDQKEKEKEKENKTQVVKSGAEKKIPEKTPTEKTQVQNPPPILAKPRVKAPRRLDKLPNDSSPFDNSNLKDHPLKIITDALLAKQSKTASKSSEKGSNDNNNTTNQPNAQLIQSIIDKRKKKTSPADHVITTDFDLDNLSSATKRNDADTTTFVVLAPPSMLPQNEFKIQEGHPFDQYDPFEALYRPKDSPAYPAPVLTDSQVKLLALRQFHDQLMLFKFSVAQPGMHFPMFLMPQGQSHPTRVDAGKYKDRKKNLLLGLLDREIEKVETFYNLNQEFLLIKQKELDKKNKSLNEQIAKENFELKKQRQLLLHEHINTSLVVNNDIIPGLFGVSDHRAGGGSKGIIDVDGDKKRDKIESKVESNVESNPESNVESNAEPKAEQDNIIVGETIKADENSLDNKVTDSIISKAVDIDHKKTPTTTENQEIVDNQNKNEQNNSQYNSQYNSQNNPQKSKLPQSYIDEIKLHQEELFRKQQRHLGAIQKLQQRGKAIEPIIENTPLQNVEEKVEKIFVPKNDLQINTTPTFDCETTIPSIPHHSNVNDKNNILLHNAHVNPVSPIVGLNDENNIRNGDEIQTPQQQQQQQSQKQPLVSPTGGLPVITISTNVENVNIKPISISNVVKRHDGNTDKDGNQNGQNGQNGQKH